MLTPSMCILALALESHPDFPLILLFNRDERFDRETEPVAPHEDGCVHATDVEAGGTWMSINSHTGALAALTNVRCAGPTGRPLESRGVLVRRAVLGEAGDPLLLRQSRQDSAAAREEALMPHRCGTNSAAARPGRREEGEQSRHSRRRRR